MGELNGHVIDDVTWHWKVKLMIPIHLEPNISKTVRVAILQQSLITSLLWGSTLDQCWNWPKRTGGSAAEMFEILPRNWNLKPIFTQKWASVDMNWGEGGSTP